MENIFAQRAVCTVEAAGVGPKVIPWAEAREMVKPVVLNAVKKFINSFAFPCRPEKIEVTKEDFSFDRGLENVDIFFLAIDVEMDAQTLLDVSKVMSVFDNTVHASDTCLLLIPQGQRTLIKWSIPSATRGLFTRDPFEQG